MSKVYVNDFAGAVDRLRAALAKRAGHGADCQHCQGDAIEVMGAAVRPRSEQEQREPPQRVISPHWVERMAGVHDHPRLGLRVIRSTARHDEDGRWWQHLSVSRRDRKLPTWEQMVALKEEWMGDDVEAYMVFPPRDRWVSIGEVLHLWMCEDSPAGVLPDFTTGAGTI